MIIRNFTKISLLFVILALLLGCDAMDTLLPSANTYKVNAQVNGMPMDDCSFVGFNDKIYPYFEEPVSNDPDVTALVVFLKNSSGDVTGKKIRYDVEKEAEQDEVLVQVKSLDDDLPFFEIPSNLSVGRYILVSQVMSGSDILQRAEKIFYYMGNTAFSYEGINVNLPGITDNPQAIPKGTVLMLETQLDFDGRMDPYIVWYSGRKKISEGRFSDGAGSLFWKAPEQSGFFSIRAEVFPVDSYIGLSGYQKEISLLVSSKTPDVNLVSENIPQLMYWYVFDGNLNDSKMPSDAQRALKPAANKKPQWLSVNGTYGLTAGYDNVYTLPKVSISNNEKEIWQTLLRFMPVDEGQIFSVLFEQYPDVSMSLSMEGQNLILKLSSPKNTVSQIVKIAEQASFITAGVNFSVLPDRLSARINVMGDSVEQGELAGEPISLEVEIKDNFQILLGTKKGDSPVESGSHNEPLVTALWDEFALYASPPMEIIASEVKQAVRNINEDTELDTIASN